MFIGHGSPSEENGLLMIMTRTGHRSLPGSLPSSRLQHVRYMIRGNQLVRQSSPFPDPVDAQDMFEQVLLKDISQIDLRYYRQGWQTGWSIDDASNTIPSAVRVTITVKNQHPVTLIVQLPKVS